jgi:hypothetical protein
MKNNRTYEVTFDNSNTTKYYTLFDARKAIKKNEYNAKVVSIVSSYLDRNSNEKRNYIKIN